MYNNYNPQVSLDRINTQIAELEKMRKKYKKCTNKVILGDIFS